MKKKKKISSKGIVKIKRILKKSPRTTIVVKGSKPEMAKQIFFNQARGRDEIWIEKDKLILGY